MSDSKKKKTVKRTARPVAVEGEETPVQEETTTPTEVVYLTLDAIEEIDDITEQDVYVEPWKGHVRVRSISKREMNQIKKGVREESDEPDQALVEKHLVLHGLVNPKIDDATYEKWLDKSAIAVETILNAIVTGSNAGSGDIKKEERTFRS